MNKSNTLKCSNKDCPRYFDGKCDHISIINKEMICESVQNSTTK